MKEGTAAWLTQSLEDLPSHDRWLSPDECARAASFRVTKRAADWRLGRWTAKSAFLTVTEVEAFARSLPQVEIRASPTGVPEIWVDSSRQPWSLSLSHSHGLAMAALAPAGVALGCDIEAIEPRSTGFLEDYFAPEERAIVDGASATDRDLLATVIWSAKESALKGLGEGFRLPLRSVRVSLESEALIEAPRDSEKDWRRLDATFHSTRRFQGRWRQQGRQVLVLLADPPSEPVRLACRSDLVHADSRAERE